MRIISALLIYLFVFTGFSGLNLFNWPIYKTTPGNFVEINQSEKPSCKVEILADKSKGIVSPMIYGQMIEHAYWSVHLGLWAQMLDNGGFELDRDSVNTSVAQGWLINSTSAENKYSARLDAKSPYNAKYSQKIIVTKNPEGEIMLFQNNLCFKKDVKYEGFVFLKGSAGKNVSVCLLSLTKEIIAQHKLGIIRQDEWKKFEFSLSPSEEYMNGSFAIVINGEADLMIDQIQLYPSDSFLGHGTRSDIVNLYKDLNPPFLRWPGGAYLVWHHWKNGIGPREDRYFGDGRILKGHDGEWDPNTFGTDEFIQLCKDLNSEPMINVNIKDGLQNTLDWIEYCNGGIDTKWGALRAKYGHKEPYNVKYWVVDNEPLAGTSTKGYTVESFPGLSHTWAMEMKKKDPRIMTLIMGSHNIRSDNVFNTKMIAETKDVLDQICVHCYYDQSFDAPLQGMPYLVGEKIAGLKKIVDSYSAARDIKVALSEWNPECNTIVAGNMGQALEAALMFNELERRSADGAIDIAAPCQLAVNTDRYKGVWLRSAMVQINNHTAWTSPMYHVNKLFSGFFEPDLLEISTKGIPTIESHSFKGLKFPALDINSTKSISGNRIIIKVVNNSDRSEYDADINISSLKKIKRIKSFDVSSDNITSVNTLFKPDKVVIKEKEIIPDRNYLKYTFKPFSVTLIEILLE
jgi:alpha-N-arabinofuranosidase